MTESEYHKLCNMKMVIYWTNKNDPNRGILSQIYPNTSSTKDRVKEKPFLRPVVRESSRKVESSRV